MSLLSLHTHVPVATPLFRQTVLSSRVAQACLAVHVASPRRPCPLPVVRSLITTCRGSGTATRTQQKLLWKEKVPKLLSSLFAVGAVLGPSLDGIHGRVHLLTYDSAAFEVAGVQTSAWVALLLGAFYASVGALHILGDHWQSSRGCESTARVSSKLNAPFVLASIGSTALLLQTSAVLYANDTQYAQIAAILAVLGAANFRIFDGTRQGFALALLCACVAPVSELVIMNVFGLWHYPHPNAFQELGRGLPAWVSACYFFYTPAVGNLARLIWNKA